MVRMLAASVIGASLVVWFIVGTLADRSVQHAVARDAVSKALHWGVYMSSHIPNIEEIIATGVTTEEQRDAIRNLRQLGDVFRFKIFNADGQLVLISDEDFIVDPDGIATDPDPEPMAVFLTGIEIVEVYDGSENPDRPDVYAEAYVPLLDASDRVIGVVEVYIDETMTVTFFEESFEMFGLLVSLFSAVLFLVPAVAFGLQKAKAERSRSEAEYLSKFDPLTGLLNRTEFTRRSRTLAQDHNVGAVLYLDLDNFKAINDTYGHAVGDAYLEQISLCLTADVEMGDLVARFGGDEFVMALRSADQSSIIRRARTILERCSEPLAVGERSLAGSISIGIALMPADAELEQAMLQADAALYHAKTAGRNQYALYGNDMGEVIRRRNMLEQRLRDAVRNDDFSVDYQPLVQGSNLELIGYEALLRLKHSDGTDIPPVDFIPLAEEIGVIEEIGQWVLKEATRAVAQLPGDPKVAVNLSVAQFRSGKLCDTVTQALADSGLPPNRLELEITESLLLDDASNIAHQIDTLQEMGVAIAMDDFGTGFSSLGYLWKYGFDRIKIDRSFVSGLGDDAERSLKIVETVILLGKRLGMQVTAEGVETLEQSEILTKLGCDVLQGYHFGRPSPLVECQDDSQRGPEGEKQAIQISVS